MTPPKAANDNTPRSADSFSDLAERRAWVAQRRHKTKPVLAWPSAERLSRLENPAAAEALYRYAELVAPQRLIAANDNDPEALDGDPDLIQEIQPSEQALLRAASDGLRCRVVSSKAKGRWSVTKRVTACMHVDGGDVQLGDLSFRYGRLTSYGETSRGRPKPITDRRRQPRGTKPAQRSEESVRFLLPANSNTPIAKNAGWLSGISRIRGTATRPGFGDHEAAEEMHRNARRAAVRLALGSETTLVLDAAITDATAKEIGELLGYTGKTAERRGIRRINDAIRDFQEIAA